MTTPLHASTSPEAPSAPVSETVAELVGRTLAELGAGHCFGVVGSGNFDVTNSLIRHGVPYTAARHEGGAATMADAFARMSGKVALLSVHQGCGLTNAATGIGEAAKSRTPLVVLAAETAGAAVKSNFAMDQPGLARSIGAVSERVHSAASAVADVVRAFRTAQNERRTVVLNLPLDVQTQQVPAPEQATRIDPPARVRPAVSSVDALADLILGARRPVFVAGRGGRYAREEILALAAHSGALVATSAVAKGLFAGEPFGLGISGGFSSPTTAELIAGADLIVGFGCALNMWTMRHGTLIGKNTAVVQVDVDDAALGANRPITLGVLGDAGATAAEVLAELKRRGAAPRPGYRTEEIRARIATSSRWQDVPIRDLYEAGENGSRRIDPRVLTSRINELLPPERVVAVDSGNFMGYPSQYLDVPDENGFCFTQAFQSIGLGLATAVGAALAQPRRLPVLGTGDGGFLMGISELETAVRLRLPLLCIVYNDAAYGAEVHHFAADKSVDVSTVTFPETDIAAIARGYGCQAITVRTPEDLAPLSAWAGSGPDRPLVIDAKIASDGGAWWLAEAFSGH
ncbi:thiamine pyrophosphate-binding protein [Arthrobacter bambusae]|uniref:Thiamine pyrophosphate-dependent acetolactate synthase large subunit-like protein n=1 Tax=Arthrobacter bambusae TaxID=1338426 RepID=A0AAW8DHL6_9MICC|nr:thiamine pyrophosphate-binding protein [Arthrobacter bambusae]MDP9906199.1 thiamine pyrophosphate-dependent acetolactate synthase large subunit-like protein [Arthrobacter bambusae]MDQ0130568.1 thiamine pyrophosphate-dependent acetolactate synthase large subunit-like protein [Arthrobacter bambusae]MDQ0182243.1 thiamine pyrophosphate-dependent acetolactate synthase large subunit-like protein [Arthrobacter bambusae]